MLIGFSTSCDYLSPPESVAKNACKLGCMVMEWATHSDDELDKIIDVENTFCTRFLVNTFHAPDRFQGSIHDVLKRISGDGKSKRRIVIHPHLLMNGIPSGMEERLLIENLDSRPVAIDFTHRGKSFGGLLAKYPDTSVCFDLAHALSVQKDPERLIEEIDGFVSRIAEVHLSFFDKNGKHCKLDENHAWWSSAEIVMKHVFEKQDPIVILETPARGLSEMQAQIDLTKRLVEKRKSHTHIFKEAK